MNLCLPNVSANHEFKNAFDKALVIIELYSKYVELESFKNESIPKINPLYVTGLILSDFNYKLFKDNDLEKYLLETNVYCHMSDDFRKYHPYLFNIKLRCAKCLQDNLHRDFDDLIECMDEELYIRYDKYVSQSSIYEKKIKSNIFKRIILENENMYHTTKILGNHNDLIIKYLDILLKEKGYQEIEKKQ
jgi:hypothetical protein